MTTHPMPEIPVRELPCFVKDFRAAGSPFPSIHYWMPDRTGDPDADERLGRIYFRQAVEFSYRPNAQMFLAHVLVAMFRNLGPMESGFIDALLEAAQVGAVPPRLTDQEIAMAATEPGDDFRLRELEGQLADAIASRKWLPDYLRLEVLRFLTGAEGELIGAAMTMIARMAINGSRN
jgi:hypothetical protein